MLELTKENIEKFDSKAYVQKYGQNDWLEKGMYEGKCSNVSPFDWKAYLERYEDLRKAGIHTKQQAERHWKIHGMNEGRIGSNIEYCPKYGSVSNNSKKNIAILVNATDSPYCGGTKTAVGLGYKLHEHFNIEYIIIDLFDNYECENVKNIISNYYPDMNAKYLYFNNRDIMHKFPSKKYNIVFATYNLTYYYAALFNYEKIFYFIQDFETLFFPTKCYGYHLAYYSYINMNSPHVTPIFYGKYNETIIKREFEIQKSHLLELSYDKSIYYNKNLERKGILLVYYKNKQRRLGDYIRQIAYFIRNKFPKVHLTCFPDNLNIENINHAGYKVPNELSTLYNEHEMAICFSDSNISRMSYEITGCGTPVFELKNENGLNENHFFLCDKDLTKMTSYISNIIMNNKIIEKRDNILLSYNHLNIDEESKKLLDICFSTNVISNKPRLFIFVSNGNLGCDYLKGVQYFQALNQHYNCIIIPTDYQFCYQKDIMNSIICNIPNESTVYIVRSFSHSKIVLKTLKEKKCKIIFDHVDLFAESGYLNHFMKVTDISLIDRYICNSLHMQTYMSRFIPINKLIVSYHHWDERYTNNFKLNHHKLIDNKEIKLGFIGCCKRLNDMLHLSIETIQKYDIQLLDCECWEYVNDKVYNNDFNWSTVNLDNKIIPINFNVQVSVRNLTEMNSLFKTNLKLSTASAMEQVIILVKEEANVEIMPLEYPFYMHEDTDQEFERIYNILYDDLMNNGELIEKAQLMLNDVKEKTRFENICQKFKKNVLDI